MIGLLLGACAAVLAGCGSGCPDEGRVGRAFDPADFGGEGATFEPTASNCARACDPPPNPGVRLVRCERGDTAETTGIVYCVFTPGLCN